MPRFDIAVREDDLCGWVGGHELGSEGDGGEVADRLLMSPIYDQHRQVGWRNILMGKGENTLYLASN